MWAGSFPDRAWTPQATGGLGQIVGTLGPAAVGAAARGPAGERSSVIAYLSRPGLADRFLCATGYGGLEIAA